MTPAHERVAPPGSRRSPRLYSLFELQEDGRWVRIVNTAYPIQQARRVYQDALLAPYLVGGPVRELQPIARGGR